MLQNVNSYCSCSACNQMVAEVGDGRRRRLPGAVVVWPRRMLCDGETGGWNWLQVVEQEERRRRKSAGERDQRCMLCRWWGVKATAGSGDGEGLMWGRWLRLWQRWWPVAEEAKEEENGRGCREERETDGGSWWSVGGSVGFLWWS